MDGSLRVQLPPVENFPGGLCGCYLASWNTAEKISGRGPGGVSDGFQSFLQEKKHAQEASCGRGKHRGQLLLPKVWNKVYFSMYKTLFLGEGNVKSRVVPSAPGSSMGVSVCVRGGPSQGPRLWLQRDKAQPLLAPRGTGMLGIRHQERGAACSVHGMGEKEGPDPTGEAPALSWGVWEGE